MTFKPLLLSLLLAGAPLGAAVTVSNGVPVNGNTCDQIAWTDSAGRPRSASIVQLNGAGQAGKVGGYISQVLYNDGAGTVTCNESGYSVDGLLSGLGQMVNHGGTGNGWVCSNQDGIKAGASTQVLFQGANHVIYQVDMDSYGDNGDLSKGTWHNRWQYFFVTGQDHIVESISYDFSSKPAGYWGYTGLYSQQGHDSRSPYCSFNWTGTGAANTLTESIDGIEWAARDSGTNSYLFKTVGSSPFSGGYTYNTPASNIPYTLQWKNSPDREIGYVSTFDLTQFAAGGGFTSESKIGLTSPTMPADWGANYQSNAFQGWRGDKMTWGVPYGSAGGALGVSTFNDWTYARTWTGYPTMGYTILIQMGKHSDDKVRQQVAQQAAIKSLPVGAYTAAVGTVPTLGRMNLQSPAADFTLKPRGYNHLYHAWEASCAAGAADVTLALGAASLSNPTFLFNGFTAASLCGLTLNGVPQVEGTDIFSSVDTVNDRLYVTFNKAFTGSQRIVVAASCGTATVTPTATPTRTNAPTSTATPTPSPTASPCGACTPTVTPTQVTATGRQYCITVDYSAVPALVNDRKLTLKVDVGNCASVSVSEDGSPLTASYNAGTGIATFTTTGLSALSSIVVTANGWTSGGTGAATKAVLYNDRGWAHSFTFDDGIRDQYTNAKPIFDAKGWRGGLSIIGSGIDGGNAWNMTWAQAQAFRAAGWDIYNHSYNHPNLSCANFASEMDLNQTAFATRFPGYKVSHVVYPYENTAASLCAAWPQAYLLSGEGGGGSYNYVDVPLPAVFRAQRGTFYGTNAASMQALPAAAAANARPTWLIVITHSVAAGSAAAADAYSTNADTLSAYLNWLDSNYGPSGDNSLWFAPSGEVQDYLFTRDNAVVSGLACGTPTPTATVCGACTATATRTPSASATPSPTATTPPACAGGLVDDLTDGDTQNAFANYWYTYAAGGTTINGAAAIVVAPGFGGAGYCARGVGSGPSSTASLGTALNAAGSNASSYSGLSFRFKGDGGAYRVQLHSLVQGGNYNDYKYDFTPPVGWSLVTVPWANFSFPGWGPAYSLDTVQLTGLSWVPMNAGAFDFSVDDVQFTCPAAASPTPTPTRSATFTATRTRTASPSPSPSPTATASARPLVGAIRWDAWVGAPNSVGAAVETSLSPSQFHCRVPFYGTEISPTQIQARCTTQACMDQEIAYAKWAGLDYWAFIWYPASSGLDVARNLYLASANKDDVKFSLILEQGQFFNLPTATLVSYFQMANYQKVLGNRPILYLLGCSGIGAADITAIRNATTAAGLGTPYIVLMRQDGVLSNVSTLGLDALSMYATSWVGTGAPYATLASTDVGQWDYVRTSGYKMVPNVTTGWDKRPRDLNPVFWEADPGPDAWVQAPTLAELTGHVQTALDWVASYPATADANTVILYAWNEFDEGGYIAPTLASCEGTARVDALHCLFFGCPSPTPTPTASRTPSASPTATRTPSPSATRSASPTASSTVSATPSSSASPSRTATPTATVTRTVSDSPTISPTYTDVPPGSTFTDTPTESPTPSSTQSPADTSTSTATATLTPANTGTPTATPTLSPANSGTPSATPTRTSTFAASATRSATPTLTVGWGSFTPSGTPTRTVTVSASSTATVVVLTSPTSTPTPTTVPLTSTPSPTNAPPPSTPLPSGTLEILDLQAVPNPNPASIALKLSGPADEVELEVYSVAETKVCGAVSGPQMAGWTRLALPPSWAQSLPNGLYYLRAVAKQGSRRSPAVRPLKIALMR